MICDMKRVAGLVTLLGLAVTAASRPALAQDAAGNSWFDGSSADGEPANGPAAEGTDQATPPPPPDSAPAEPQGGPDDSDLMDPNQPPSAPPADAQGSQPYGAPPQAQQRGPTPVDNTSDTDPRAITEFRSTLDPYGTWLNDPKYGTVWVPNSDAVGDDFAPYVSAGHWALSDDNDWVWQSDYPFGDVVFHYGRWVWIPGTGWSWVAGSRYANAWVSWRVPTDDYGYVGWAPMPPAWGWYGGAAVSLGWYPPAAYVFCPSLYAFSPRVHSYIVHDQYVVHDVAAHSRNYSASGRAGSQRVAGTPRPLPANSAPPHGPSLQSAHVPASAAPMRAAQASARFGVAGSYRSSGVYSRATSQGSAYPRTAYQASQYQGVYGGPPSSHRASAYGAGAASPWPAYSAPSTNYRATARTWSAPSAPRYNAAPSAPAYHYSAPSASTYHYSAPSQHYSAPVQHYSAPAYHYSAPAQHYSAPSFHSAPAFHFSSRR
jgi:hypothetical protein